MEFVQCLCEFSVVFYCKAHSKYVGETIVLLSRGGSTTSTPTTKIDFSISKVIRLLCRWCEEARLNFFPATGDKRLGGRRLDPLRRRRTAFRRDK